MYDWLKLEITKFPNFKSTSPSPKELKKKTLFIMVIMIFFEFFFTNQGSRGYAKYNDKENSYEMKRVILSI